MSALIILIFRLAFIYLAIRFIWSIFIGKKNTISHGQKKARASAKRFETRGENIVDGEFEEMRGK